MIDFANTKFAKFKSVKVEIHCPVKEDPGQLLYARAAVLDLVCALRGLGADIQHCEPYSQGDDYQKLEPKHEYEKTGLPTERFCLDPKIPELQIVFLNTETDTWHEDRSIRSSFNTCFYNDLDVLVAPFGYLFNVQQIEFKFPEVLTQELGRYNQKAFSRWEEAYSHKVRFLELCQYVREQAQASYLFELHWRGPTDFYLDEEIERYLFLDNSLDTAPGPTAAVLRRERLIHHRWYRKIFKRLLDLQVYCEDHKEYYEAAQIRYRDFGYLDRSYQDHGWKLHKTQDPNWLEEWRRYWPTGIPPKGSPEWNLCIAAASR